MTTTTATATATGDIALEVFSKPQHKVYDIRFASETLALAWIQAHPWEFNGVRSDTYVTQEALNDDQPLSGCRYIDADTDPTLYDLFYPTCEHGMSGLLCAGPGHYPADEHY